MPNIEYYRCDATCVLKKTSLVPKKNLISFRNTVQLSGIPILKTSLESIF